VFHFAIKVGLAVCDIDTVQREATLQSQAMQVEFVGQLEEKYPRFITRLVYKKSFVEYPNKVGKFTRYAGIDFSRLRNNLRNTKYCFLFVRLYLFTTGCFPQLLVFDLFTVNGCRLSPLWSRFES